MFWDGNHTLNRADIFVLDEVKKSAELNQVLNMFGSRLVHIDLKGAPFKLNYWEELIPFLSKIGINGLLIEYEDMFPYNDFLSEISCENVYDYQQIESILRVANNYDLKIIPLIQTFGHLEFVLKHEVFRELREVQTYPNSICPTNQKSFEVIKEMLRQMISLHQKFTKLEAIHIGCDEVWHLEHCSRCQTYLTNGLERGQLFIDFVLKISQFIRKSFGIKVIIWDDMLRNINIQHIIESKLNLMIEPMVWHYFDINSFRLTDNQFWQIYKQLFADIWIASAFKGAIKMNQIIPPISYHISNQLAWLNVIHNHQLSNIKGFVLTGWQRFDHFTTLCELFPNSIISLLMSLFALNGQTFDKQIQQKASEFIANKSLIPIEINSITDLESIDDNIYPGVTLFKLTLQWMFSVKEFNDLKSNQSLEGAFTPYLIKKNRTNPLHIQTFIMRARMLLLQIRDLKLKIESEMRQIFYESTIEEWIETYVNPILKKLEKIVMNGDQQLAIHLKTDVISEPKN